MPEHHVIDAINNSPLNRGLDGAAWVATPGNIAVEVGDNIALFDWCGDGIFEGHFLFVSTGRLAIMAARESFRRMFEDHAASLLFGLIPSYHRAAKLVARWAGARFVGVRETAFGPCDLFVYPREFWKGIDQ